MPFSPILFMLKNLKDENETKNSNSASHIDYESLSIMKCDILIS